MFCLSIWTAKPRRDGREEKWRTIRGEEKEMKRVLQERSKLKKGSYQLEKGDKIANSKNKMPEVHCKVSKLITNLQPLYGHM